MSKPCAERELIGAPVERRKAARFLLRVPVIFKWNDERGQSHEGTGFSRDVSTSGIFVMTDIRTPFGVAIELDVLLPPLQDSGTSLRLSAAGIVLRVTDAEGPRGFASTSDFAAIAGEAESAQLVY